MDPPKSAALLIHPDAIAGYNRLAARYKSEKIKDKKRK